MHGVGTDAARASRRTGPGTGSVGYSYLHGAVDDHSRLVYTEAMEDERAITAAAFWDRAVAFFAAHDIIPVHRVLTHNGSCYRSRAWAAVLAVTMTKHKRTRPYTRLMARSRLHVRGWTPGRSLTPNYYNHERPHAAIGG